MGDAYYNLKRYASANQTYSKLVKEFPKSKEAPEAEFGTLFSLYQEKKFDSFIARAEAFVKRYPQNPLASQALMQLGEYYQQNRMREKAIKTCREIIHLSPGSPGAEDAQLRISFLLKQERRWTEAIEEMEKFLRLSPKSHQVVQTHVEMGDLYILLKEYAKAVEQYEWVIQNYPHHSLVKKAYLGMEEGYQNSGKMEQVEKILKDLVTKFPQDDIRFEGQLRLGLFYLAQKRPMDAVPVLSAAIRSPEERVASQAHFKLGEAYLEGENRELALLQFSKVVYLYPHRPEVMEEALLKLGTLYMDENKLSEARQIYQKLMEKTKMEDRKELARRMLDRIDKGTIR